MNSSDNHDAAVRKVLRGNIFLILASVAWGTTFVVQRTAMDHLGPFTYSGLRFLLGALFLLPLAAHRFTRKVSPGMGDARIKTSLLIGASCLTGSLVCLGINLQQIGMIFTTAGKAGFITGLYVIIVPFLGVFLGHRANLGVWIGASLALAGLYLLSVTEAMTLAPGDAWILASAFVWACQVLTLGWLSPKIDTVMLAFGQSFVCGVLSLLIALCVEDISMSAISAARIEILYGGIISVGLGFTLQVSGQKYSPASHAAVIMQLEAVFAALSGWIFLEEVMNSRALGGAALMLVAMLVAQFLPSWRTLKAGQLLLPK